MGTSAFFSSKARLLLTCLFAVSIADTALAEEGDPLAGYNKFMFEINDTLDRNLLKPTAKGYRAILPDPAEKSVSNFFGNLDDLVNLPFNLLQGKVSQSANDTGRFLLNSTLGVAGLFDVAQGMGLQKNHAEDLGQTLGAWGVGSGAYIVLPLMGPSSVRDAPSTLVSRFLNPVNQLDSNAARISLNALDIIQIRASLLDTERLISGDPYYFIRDAYQQRREFLVHDGDVPQSSAEDDFGDF